MIDQDFSQAIRYLDKYNIEYETSESDSGVGEKIHIFNVNSGLGLIIDIIDKSNNIDDIVLYWAKDFNNAGYKYVICNNMKGFMKTVSANVIF